MHKKSLEFQGGASREDLDPNLSKPHKPVRIPVGIMGRERDLGTRQQGDWSLRKPDENLGVHRIKGEDGQR